MSLPSNFAIVAYSCGHAMPGFEAVAHVFEEREHKKTGRVYSTPLPATAYGESPDVAREKLTAFLQAEITAEAKRREHAAALGAARRKVAA